MVPALIDGSWIFPWISQRDPSGEFRSFGWHPASVLKLRPVHLGVVEIDRPALEIRVSEVELICNARFGKLYQVQQLTGAPGSQWTDSGQPYLGKDGFITIKIPVPTEGTGSLFRVVELP